MNMKKYIILLFTTFIIASCASDYETPKKTMPVKVEITSTFTTSDISHFYFKEIENTRCRNSWGERNNYNQAMTLYAIDILNNSVNNNQTADGYVEICDGRVTRPSYFYNFLRIYISDVASEQSYRIEFGDPDSYEYIVGYEQQLINQAINQFKSDPTASYIGNFYVEVDETY